jgi:type IV pilus assembly protein PilX
MKNATYCQVGYRRQRGISLITVLVILLLSLMAVMGAFRAANLNETILGSTADYNRAREAAEALIRDAELDINGRRPPYTTVQADGSYGFPCRPSPPSSAASLATEVGYVGCRTQPVDFPPPAGSKPWFPTNSEDFDTVSTIVTSNSATEHCQDAICVPLSMAEHAHIEDNLATMSPLGATYGQFTRNALTAPGVSSNPILTPAADGTARGWYWVELFRYSEMVNSGAAASASVIPDPSKPFVFRITAVALGLKPGTRVVLTSVFVPFPKKP